MIKNLLRESWVKTGWNCTNAPSTKTNTQTAYLSMLVYQYARFPLLGQTRLAGVSPWRGCWVLVPVRCNHIHFMILTWVVGHAGAFSAEPAASQPQGTQRHTTIRDHTYTRHAHILTHTQPEGQFRVLEQTHSVVIVSKSFFFLVKSHIILGPVPIRFGIILHVLLKINCNLYRYWVVRENIASDFASLWWNPSSTSSISPWHPSTQIT